MRFDLVDLRLFAAAVESGSITRGAEAVHLALASASARIAALEAARESVRLTSKRSFNVSL